MTPSQVQAFRDSIPFRSDYGSTMGLACNYQQHHRVKIDQANGEIFVFGICFECGQINLNNNGPRIMSTGWYSSLERFITSLGLHPEGPFGN